MHSAERSLSPSDVGFVCPALAQAAGANRPIICHSREDEGKGSVCVREKIVRGCGGGLEMERARRSGRGVHAAKYEEGLN
jgi:hypothetical protein